MHIHSSLIVTMRAISSSSFIKLKIVKNQKVKKTIIFKCVSCLVLSVYDMLLQTIGVTYICNQRVKSPCRRCIYISIFQKHSNFRKRRIYYYMHASQTGKNIIIFSYPQCSFIISNKIRKPSCLYIDHGVLGLLAKSQFFCSPMRLKIIYVSQSKVPRHAPEYQTYISFLS